MRVSVADATERLEVKGVAVTSSVAGTSLVVVTVGIASRVSIAVVLAVVVAVARDQVVTASAGVGDRADSAGETTNEARDSSNLGSRGCENRGGERKDGYGDCGTHFDSFVDSRQGRTGIRSLKRSERLAKNESECDELDDDCLVVYRVVYMSTQMLTTLIHRFSLSS